MSEENSGEKKESSNEGGNKEITLDFSKFLAFFKNNKWIIPVLLIIIAIGFSTFFRMYPADLPATEDWAENSVKNSYINRFKSQVEKQYPQLPDENKASRAEQKYQEYKENNPKEIQKQIDNTAQYFKSKMQYEGEDGDSYTYLLAIDPYLWYGYGKNTLKCGHAGCDQKEDGNYYTYRNGRFGQEKETPFISYLGIGIHKVQNFFGSAPLMQGFFLIPVVMMGLAVIPAFFIGRRLGGNIGGFFASMIIAVNSAVLGRTPGGFSDNDAANVMFPLFMMWFLIEAFYSRNWKRFSIFSILGGLGMYFYINFWNAHYVMAFLLAIAGIYIAYLVIKEITVKRAFKIKEIVNKIKIPFAKLFTFIIVALIGLIVGGGFNIIVKIFRQLWEFAFIKVVAVKSLWPNVMTTVAEFNAVPLDKIIGQMGGPLLFMLALAGVVLSFIKKDNNGERQALFAILLIVWFFGTGFAFTKGVRFAILMVPAFAVALGTGIGIIYTYLSNWLSRDLNVEKRISAPVITILFLLLLIAPVQSAHNTAMNEIPSYNDAWDSTLEGIKEDASDGIGYITTWWDFGHWFVANDIRVTFDGGSQGEKIHWVGKSFLTDKENVSAGTIRMLNCGQELPPHLLECYMGENEWEWDNEIAGKGECSKKPTNNITVKAIDVLNKIILENRSEASEILKNNNLSESEIDTVLKYTHCEEDKLPQYVIASEDMVGKSGVWGHFGDWDFERAAMWQNVNGKSYSEGLDILNNDFGLNETRADKLYHEIQTNEADRWVADWPSYMGQSGCSVSGNEVNCRLKANQQTVPLTINLDNYDAHVQGNEELKPDSLVYVDGDEVKEKELEGESLGFSAILVPQGESGFRIVGAQPKQANSMFTRLFFFKGHGLEKFKLFSEKNQVNGQKILTYKLDWDNKTQRNVYHQEKNEIKASHILIETKNRTEDEALELAENISEKINESNFGELAREYSEGPSSTKGGSLGWFGKDEMVSGFSEEAFEMDINETSSPVKSQFGYHIIKVYDKRKVNETSIYTPSENG